MEKNKKHISKIQKTRKQNKRGTKREKQRTYKKRQKWTCPFAIFFDLLGFSFFVFAMFHFFVFLPGEKTYAT